MVLESHWLSHGGRSYLHDPCDCSQFSVAVCGPVRCASAQPLAPCLLAGDLAHIALDEGGWRCVGVLGLGSRAFVRDSSADKLSARVSPASSLAFPLTNMAGSFTTPPSTVSSPLWTSHLTNLSQVDPLPGAVLVEVDVDSGAARGAASRGVASRCAEPARAELGGAEPNGAELRGAESEGAESGGAAPKGTASSRAAGAGGSTAGGTGAGGTGAGGVGATSLGGATVAGLGGSRTRGTGAAGTGDVGGAGAGGAGAGEPGAGGAGTWHCSDATVPDSPLLAPSPYAEQTDSFTEHREPESRPASPVCDVRTGRQVTHPRPPLVPGIHVMALCLSSVPLRVPVPPPPEFSLPAVPNPESYLARVVSPAVSHLLATVITNPPFESTAASALVAKLVYFASEDFECLAAAIPHLVAMLLAPNIPTPRSYAEAIMGPYSSQWQKAMDAEMPCGFSGQRQGVDFFQTFSPTAKMTTLRVLLHVATQRDYELHSLDFSTAFLQGSLHEEIWLRRPPGFTGSFPAALGFPLSTADLSLFLRTATLLSPFYVLLRDTPALTWVLQRFGFRYSSPQSTHLPTGHSLSDPPSDESVEPSGPYPELVGGLITSGMGLVLGGWGPVLLTGHADASWVDDLATHRSSSCEAEIYAEAMAAQELRWLTYLLTNLGEWPRSSPVLYVDNKAMIA
ncbi:unnamed protein product [Closterium sp. NIES-53]